MRSCTDTHVHVTANRADDDTRLFVVYSPSPKKHPRTSPVTVDANSGCFLIGTAQNTHVKWTKKSVCVAVAVAAAAKMVGASVVRYLNWWRGSPEWKMNYWLIKPICR